MLQDTTLNRTPDQLEELLKHCDKHKMSNAAVLFQLVYLVALECGFAEQHTFEQCESELKFSYIVPAFYDQHNVDCLVQEAPLLQCDKKETKFGMHLCSIAQDRYLEDMEIDRTAISTHLDGIVTGDFMIVTMTPSCIDPTVIAYNDRSVCLTISRYLVGTVANDVKRPIQQYLFNMEEFVSLLRNEIFIPVRSYHMELLNIDIYPALMGLPGEVFEVLLDNMNITDMCNLAKVNTGLHDYIINSKQYMEKNKKHVRFFPVLVGRSTTSSDEFDVEPYF